jgi:hypothetical protein
MTLDGRRFCRADPGDAWVALLDFRSWLDVLDTVDALRVEGPGAFPATGAPFTIVTGEGLELHCRIAGLEPGRRLDVSIRGLRSLFRSDVRDEIEPVAGGCVVSRRETYRGPVSRALAWIWRARQREELGAFVREWCWEAERRAAVRRAGG